MVPPITRFAHNSRRVAPTPFLPPTLTLRCLHTPLKYNSPSVVPLDHTNIYFMDQSFICLLRKHRSGSFSLSLMQLYAFLVSLRHSSWHLQRLQPPDTLLSGSGHWIQHRYLYIHQPIHFIICSKSTPVHPAKRQLIYQSMIIYPKALDIHAFDNFLFSLKHNPYYM